MDRGRAVVGASIVGALVLAAGLAIELAPARGLSTDILGGCVSGTFPDDDSDAAAWFLTEFANDTAQDVHVRTVRVDTVQGVRLEHLALAPHPTADAAGLTVTEDAARPSEYGRTVPVDSGVVVPPHGHLDVVGRFVLDQDQRAGFVRAVVVTEQDRLGRLRTVTDPSAYGVGRGEDLEPTELGCEGP
ncbi:hypothetical protein [Curtobacterium sp. 260]|uniref:hypothetical protein n=1 Tax=Curtobacterium sp. 260 TaxID=2817748 RepID=UPI00278B2818|nr:hypothetical protein [Curtobacterium sp. 260]MDP9736830.1 hypothetical protein [Curtobacterium sp. 260]